MNAIIYVIKPLAGRVGGPDGFNYPMHLLLEDPVSHGEPTMFLKRNVIFYKGFKIFSLLYHVVHCLLSVLEVIS